AFGTVDGFFAACRATPPDAVVVAGRMEGEQGHELVARLRRGGPMSAPVDTACVLVSPDEGDRGDARLVSAAFLRVPFSAGELLDAVGAATRGRKLVLLADDSALIHRHTVPILEEAGYDVVSAFDGAEALELIDERKPDLVITDVEMPKLDGYGVCKAIKERCAAGQLPPTPVIICSALGEAADLERGFDAGADDYLVKPAAPDELTSRVRSLLMTFGVEPGQRERILVVDDSPAIRHLIADALGRQGFNVTVADDGQNALERAREARFDMIVTDYDMPRLTGFELVHALKRDPKLRDIPTLMLTARDTRRDQAQMRAVGLTSYLVKPFSVDKCIAMVERVLAERRLIAYKEASRLYISDGAVRAAEETARAGSNDAVRADAREMAVLFSDICGFTSMSSTMQPMEVVELLNSFFDAMCPVLKDEAADIDKFIGDAIMALFDELPDGDPAPLRAVRAGLAMQTTLRAWNEKQHRDPPLMIRIGVNMGPVVRGDIGSKHVRRDYTVIGDVVNRAQRFEANAPKGGVLVGEMTYLATRDHIEYEPCRAMHLKGVTEAVNAYVALRVKTASELSPAARCGDGDSGTNEERP
ncbi:MAG TPA: response regulator, partial [Polyangia bacterium]|nr:response regulator [Polyangia bacterium]